MLSKKEFVEIRNATITSLYNKSKLRYTEIANLQVQDLDENKIMVRLQRGDRIFRVALSPLISDNLKLLAEGKKFDEYIFNSKQGNQKPLSRSAVTKIIDKSESVPYGTKQNDCEGNRYTVENVVCDYGVFKDGILIKELIFNDKHNAMMVSNILNADTNYKRYM